MNKEENNIPSIPEGVIGVRKIQNSDIDISLEVYLEIMVPVVGQVNLERIEMVNTRIVTDLSSRMFRSFSAIVEREILAGEEWIKMNYHRVMESGKANGIKNIDFTRISETVFTKADEIEEQESEPFQRDFKDMQEMFWLQSSTKLREEMVQVVNNTVFEFNKHTKEGICRTSNLVHFVGVIQKCGSTTEPDLNVGAKKVMKLLNWGVEEGIFKHGFLQNVNLISLELIAFGSNGEWIKNGVVVYEGKEKDSQKINSLYEGFYKRRFAIMSYPVSTLRPEEINKKVEDQFGVKGFSCYEGSIPKYTIEQ